MTVKRSYVALDYYGAEQEDPFFNYGISRSLSKSSPLHSTNPSRFFPFCFQKFVVKLIANLKGKRMTVYPFEKHFSLQFFWTKPEEYIYIKN